MKTLQMFLNTKPEQIPAGTAWYLADLERSLGRQELFTHQSPQRLKILREHALVESAISSNRIEGVEVDQKRIGTIVFGKPLLCDRDEEEVRGYRDALDLIHQQGNKLPVTEETIRKLHKMTRGDVWDAGQYKEKESDIIEKTPDGRERIRFRTVRADQTEKYVTSWVEDWHECLKQRPVHPLIALACSNLDFLCIHPFRDGNGRTSRLLFLLQCYHLGYEVGRYISLERLIEQNKERYYETLEISSEHWHEGRQDPWPYVNFLLYILKAAYQEFEERVGKIPTPKGAKTELVQRAIQKREVPFRISEIRQDCPGVGLDLIRKILKELRSSGAVECLGRGQNAQWQRIK